MHRWERSVQYKLVAVIVTALVAAAFWTGQTAHADDAEWQGIIDSMPADGLMGEWTVAGRTFIAGAGTEFRQDKGPLAVGVCVEVEYVGASAPYSATKIASKNADDCIPGTSTPDASPTSTPEGTPESTPEATPDPSPEGTRVPGGEQEVYGIVESMPTSGFIGLWRISGVDFQAPAGAEFEQEDGPLTVGACVKVHYDASTTPFTVRELESESPSDCNGAPSPDGTPTPVGEIEVYGRVDAFPDSLIGLWTVDGVSYNATGATEFEQEDGRFAEDACVKIHADNNTPANMREIETERDYRCGSNSGDDGDDGAPSPAGEAELYGILQSFPAEFVGTWNIGGMSFVADGTTEFEQEHGPFGVGVTVKVHFSTDASGVHRAREIETKFANENSGDDDDGNGARDGAEGHAFGTIDAFPSGLVGTWQISGVEYQANNATRFEESDGSFGVDARVKVEYYVNANGARTAKKIETTSDAGGSTSPSHAIFFGFVRAMPTTGLVGDWTVDNAVFVAEAATEFKEEHGLLGIGAFVKVEYRAQDGRSIIHEIETHVPPGAGPNSTMGVIEDNGGTVTASGVQAATWVIDGTAYTVLAATELNDDDAALTVGNSAVVNSYVATDGSRVATRIRGVTVSSRIFLPLATR